jgi:hypothetical protein
VIWSILVWTTTDLNDEYLHFQTVFYCRLLALSSNVTDLLQSYFTNDFRFTTDSLLIYEWITIEFIPICTASCSIVSRIIGSVCCFRSNDLVSKSLHLSIFVSMDTLVTSTATRCFPRVYSFLSLYPWTRLFNTQRWFVSKNCISEETCLPIRFLETANVSE